MDSITENLPTDSKWHIIDMHGREVAIQKIDGFHYIVCIDCGQPAKYKMLELDDIAKDKEMEVENTSGLWYWCGNCDIGG